MLFDLVKISEPFEDVLAQKKKPKSNCTKRNFEMDLGSTVLTLDLVRNAKKIQRHYGWNKATGMEKPEPKKIKWLKDFDQSFETAPIPIWIKLQKEDFWDTP